MSLSSSWELKTYCFFKVTFLYFLLNFLMAYFFPYLSFKETSTQDECTEVSLFGTSAYQFNNFLGQVV